MGFSPLAFTAKPPLLTRVGGFLLFQVKYTLSGIDLEYVAQPAGTETVKGVSQVAGEASGCLEEGINSSPI